MNVMYFHSINVSEYFPMIGGKPLSQRESQRDKKKFGMKTFIAFITLLLILLPSVQVMAQTKQVEKLNRGLVAVKNGDGYYLKWRLLGNEPYTIGFNVYRGSEKLNPEPLTGPTGYIDEIAPENSVYTVTSVIDGVESEPSKPARVINLLQGTNAGYFDIPLNRPPAGPNGGTYHPNDASVGDLTGNGEYEIVVMWDPSNAKDNAHSGITDNVYLDAYTLDGALLWRIDLGPNIRAGAHYTQFMVYDFDGDGRAELMVKTAPGTMDGLGNYINMGPAAEADHSKLYRNASGYILSGPEYLTVFNGSTGQEMATVEYVPGRGKVSDWGDSYGNRVDRFLAGVAYVDGERPSAIFCRGYYTRMVVVAWDWRDGELTHRWTFDTDDDEYDTTWEGQGNHQLAIVDANNDGKHDIVYGSVVIASDGTGMHTTGLGHGDALHATHMIKDDPIPKIFMPHEWKGEGAAGVTVRNADDGSMVFRVNNSNDIGRGAAAELDPNLPGFKFWASSGLGLYDITGTRVGNIPYSINHVIWWDGNLSRELLDQNQITKWNISTNTGSLLLNASGASSINGTKANPNLQVDLLGDWREEVIFRTTDNTRLRVYTTTMPTEHRLYTFMHDPVYRVAIAWQNTAYNQPPHPGFYVASDMDFPVPEPQVAPIDMELNDCYPMAISPFLKLEGEELQSKDRITVTIGDAVTLSPEAEGDGTWSWTGPNGYTASTREITLSDFKRDMGGIYVASFKVDCGVESKQYFTINFQATIVTFRVLMAKSGMDLSRGVYITGTLTDWDIVPMEDKGNSMYEYSVELKPEARHAYYFLNTDSWDNLEQYRETVPEACANSAVIMDDPEWTTDRAFIVPYTNITYTYAWGACDDKLPTSAIADISSNLRIFPNPTNGVVNIDFGNALKHVSIDVIDLSGKVLSTTYHSNVSETTLDISGFSSGIYMIRFTSGYNTYHSRIVLQ